MLAHQAMNQPARRRLENEQGGVLASTKAADPRKNARPDLRVQGRLVDQADGVVEIGYPKRANFLRIIPLLHEVSCH
jgi:hypothetical protein